MRTLFGPDDRPRVWRVVQGHQVLAETPRLAIAVSVALDRARQTGRASIVRCHRGTALYLPTETVIATDDGLAPATTTDPSWLPQARAIQTAWLAAHPKEG